MGNLNVIQKWILPHREESKTKTGESKVELLKKMDPGENTQVMENCAWGLVLPEKGLDHVVW